MKKVHFVFQSKIYIISENAGNLLIYKEDGTLLLQTTPQKLSKETSAFSKLAISVYNTLIRQN